jgi:transposase-like protein
LVVSIHGAHLYLWRAVDGDGDVLEMLVKNGGTLEA